MGTGYRYTIKTLWGLAKSKELGLTEEELHLLVARETGKDSIPGLGGAAGPCPVPPDVLGGRSGMADLLPVPGID